ncbi:hypothetical protein QEN19_004272 [Hanseniaspora menglaensis]
MSSNISITNRERRQSTAALSRSIDQQHGVPISESRTSDQSKVFIDLNSPSFKSRNHDEIVNSLQKQPYFNNERNSKHFSEINDENIQNQSHEAEPLLKRNSMSSSSSQTPKISSPIASKRPSFDKQPLNREGADITRDIYNIINNNGSNIKNKNYSSDDIDLLLGTSYGSLKSGTPPLSDFSPSNRRESTASALNVPGGFRRYHLIQKLDPTVNQLTENNSTINNNFLPSPIYNTSSDVAGSEASRSRRNSRILFDTDSDGNEEMAKLPFLTRNFLEFLYFYGHFAGESFEDELYDRDDIYNDDDDGQQPLLPLDKKLVSKIERMINPSKTKGTISTFKAFLLLIKSFIGTGVLFLPKAFSNGGLLFSSVALFLCGIYSYWCYYILVLSKTETKVTSFGDIGLKLYGKWLKYLILFALALTQLGFSSAYVVFTSSNLEAFMRNVFKLDLPITWFLALQMLIFIPMSFIRNVAKLSVTSLIANFLTLAGLIIVVFYILKELIYNNNFRPADGVVPVFNSNSYTVAIGTFIFSFEGIGLIIPVSESMKHPEKFPKVLLLVIGISTFIFIFVATLGYSAFGAKIQTIILLNLPQSSIFVNLIQLFYSIAIMLSTPLQLFPAIAIIESKIFQEFNKNKKNKPKSEQLRIKWLKNTLRSFIVLFTITVAYCGSSNLDRFVSIIGCFACIPLVYVFPPMLHLKSVSENSGKNSKILFDYVLIFFGVVSMIFTSYQTVKSN